jgi:hypothetical protein
MSSKKEGTLANSQVIDPKKSQANKQIKEPEAEPVPPPERKIAIFLDAYPEKMIKLREAIELEEQKREEAQRLKEQEEANPNKSSPKKPEVNKSHLESKSGNPADPNNKDKEKPRRDSFDVKHLEASELHLCYHQNKTVLTIDSKKSIPELREMMDSGPETHYSFWIYFQSINYEHPSTHLLTQKTTSPS